MPLNEFFDCLHFLSLFLYYSPLLLYLPPSLFSSFLPFSYFSFSQPRTLFFPLHPKHLLRILTMGQTRDQHTFSVKIQVVNTLGFGGYMVSAITTELYWESSHRPHINKWACLCSNKIRGHRNLSFKSFSQVTKYYYSFDSFQPFKTVNNILRLQDLQTGPWAVSYWPWARDPKENTECLRASPAFCASATMAQVCDTLKSMTDT